MPEPRARVLFLPELRRGHGIGHIVRSADLASRISGAALIIPGPESWNPTLHPRKRVLDIVGAISPRLQHVSDVDRGSDQLLVLDRREVSIAEMERFLERGPVLGLDLGGAGRPLASLLVDNIDRWQSHGPNSRRMDLLPLPRRRRSAPPRMQKPRVLLSLGGEDPGGSGPELAQTLRSAGYSIDHQSPVLGSAGKFDTSLRERMADYDVVVCGFGLTALQASAAGCRVLVVPLSRYHRRLAQSWGFAVADSARAVVRRLSEWDEAAEKRQWGAPPAGRGAEDLATADPEAGAAWLGSLVARGPHRCPVCGSCDGGVLARFPERTYRRCSSCGMLWMAYVGDSPVTYGPDYFGREYREQYGRSYLEDFADIEERGRNRLRWIAWLRGPLPAGSRVLDAGCAYGPFLQAASGLGLRPYGLDVSETSVTYVRAELGIPCVRSAIEDFDLQNSFGINSVDMVTLWYVIEHLADIRGALDRVRQMLPPGGLLAFSTPCGSGISARRDQRAFLENSPRDHFTIWEPRRVSAILNRCGFRVLGWRSTGHHPERFGRRAGPLRTALRMRASRVFRLGDTFEVLAERSG